MDCTFELYNGDCIEVMKQIPDNSVDMILCDLPYGVTHNSWDIAIPFDKLWDQYNRITKETSPILLFAQGIFYVDVVQSNRDNFRYDIVWDKILKGGFLNANVMPLRMHEQIAVFYKKKPIYNPQMEIGDPLHTKGKMIKPIVNNNYGKFDYTDDSRKGSTEKYPSSIIRFQKPTAATSIHPTQKPVELLEYLIRTYTNEGDVVLDNTMGSGSTGVACMRTDRKFIGIELDENYFKVAQQRIKDASKRLF